MEKRWRRLPGSRTEPAGLERKVLARLFWWGDESYETARSLQMVDIWVISAVLLHWTVLATVAIYCFIVFVMKGPAYVADRYELPDEDAPR